MWVAAASVVAVLAIAIGAYSLQSDGHHSAPAGGGGAAALLTGTHWSLSGVRTATNTYPVPAGYRAELSFTAHGRVTGQDGLNALAGTYRTSGNKITIRITEAGAAGGTSTFPAQQAMSSLYVPTSLSSDSVTSTYTLTPGTLTLDTGTWTVTFDAASSTQSPPNRVPSTTSRK